MNSNVAVKLCGLSRPVDMSAAVAAGARYVGFTFFPKSPRNVDLPTAAALALSVPDGICKVALTVNATDAELGALLKAVPIDMLQLHGAETPDRVQEVKTRFGLPVMKAVGVADAEDLPQLEAYLRIADQILIDAKPPRGADLPGGNGLSFDWRLIAGRRWPVPWMLAGGLNSDNVAEAIRVTGTRQVDVSSGVESAAGVKDAGLMAAFVEAASKGAS